MYIYIIHTNQVSLHYGHLIHPPSHKLQSTRLQKSLHVTYGTYCQLSWWIWYIYTITYTCYIYSIWHRKPSHDHPYTRQDTLTWYRSPRTVISWTAVSQAKIILGRAQSCMYVRGISTLHSGSAHKVVVFIIIIIIIIINISYYYY